MRLALLVLVLLQGWAANVRDEAWNFDSAGPAPDEAEVDAVAATERREAMGERQGLPPPSSESISDRLARFGEIYAAPEQRGAVLESWLAAYRGAATDDATVERLLNAQLREAFGVDLTAPDVVPVTLKLGETHTMDHLGPLIVNKDGTLRRISNWSKMTNRERKVALRRVTKRNRERLAALKEEKNKVTAVAAGAGVREGGAEVEGEGGAGAGGSSVAGAEGSSGAAAQRDEEL